MDIKVAIITGTSSGIGKATAQKFIIEGYYVFGMGRRECSESFSNYTYIRGDISNKEDRERLLNVALSKSGKIDVLVNVAGVAPNNRCDILQMTEDSYDRVMDINTKSTMFLTQLVANSMINNPITDGVRGYICNTSSLSAYAVSSNRGEYCVSKAGVSMITKLFAERLAEYKIPVNEVRPGIIATEMTEGVKEKYDKLISNGLIPDKRWGTPEDIALCIYALSSGAMPYVTGQSVDVDGGFHIQKL